jgi:membrane-associated PAP2 superfamily phosphatase
MAHKLRVCMGGVACVDLPYGTGCWPSSGSHVSCDAVLSQLFAGLQQRKPRVVWVSWQAAAPLPGCVHEADRLCCGLLDDGCRS